jgi:putative DNA primase/helicase
VTLDKSDAFYRRIFLIDFPNKFEAGNGADPMIVEKIPQEEIEGLLYQCLGILKDLISRKFVFTKHEETERIIEKYEKLSNPLKTFLDEKAEKDIDSYIRIGEFKDKFTDYLKENNYNLWTPQKLNREMKEEGFIPITKENTRVWNEIKWK